MKRFGALITTFLVGFSTTLVFSQNRAVAQTQTICSGSPIPPGWVVTSKQVGSGRCGPAINSTATTIRNINGLPTGSFLNVCIGSPIPSGWVVSGEFLSNSCGIAVNSTARTIRRS